MIFLLVTYLILKIKANLNHKKIADILERTVLFLKHLKANCGHNSVNSKCFSGYFPQNDIIPHNHNTTIKLRKINIGTFLPSNSKASVKIFQFH